MYLWTEVTKKCIDRIKSVSKSQKGLIFLLWKPNGTLLGYRNTDVKDKPLSNLDINFVLVFYVYAHLHTSSIELCTFEYV